MTTTAQYLATRKVLISPITGLMVAPEHNAALVFPHGDECDYCRIRKENYRASEARRARYLARLKRLCLTDPSERALTAYTDALAYDWR